jgi:hypothetical protein
MLFGVLETVPINPKEVLARIAVLHLIRHKVVEIVTPQGPNKPPKVSGFCFVCFLLLNFLSKEFDIDDGGWTDVHIQWKMNPNWKKEHDKALLLGVLKYPYCSLTF